jgi:quercetin dioxygenase-like cupin family protein
MSELADSNISIVNDVFIKQMVFRKAGDRVMTHAHVYDHQSLLATGRLKLTVDGAASYWQAPSILVIQQGKYHEMEALEDHTVAYCIHAIKGADHIDEAEPLVIGLPNTALSQLA